MKKGFYTVLIAATLLLSAFIVNNAIEWKIAEGYAIKFTGKGATGVFTKLEGEILFDEENLDSSKFDVKVDVNSINTGNGLKNKHAKGEDWFDAKNYPFIYFVSKKFAKTDNGYEVAGVMEMHGVKKEFMMPFTFSNNTFKSSFMINRHDFNIGPTAGLGGNVANELTVEISVPVTKKE